MIGQEKLLKYINSFTLKTLPKTLLFIGEQGSGRRTIISSLAERLNLEQISIDENIDADTLVEYQQYPLDRIYIIDLSKFNDKQQNKLLKFIEEPSVNMHIMLIAESENTVLPTILSRCIINYLEQYTEEQLKQFREVDKELAYKVCKTPGQLVNLDVNSLDGLYKLCHSIVTKIEVASYANTMTIATKINYKDDNDKYDLNLFFNMLDYVALEEYKKTNSQTSFTTLLLTTEYRQRLLSKQLLKENLMVNFLTKLWKLNRSNKNSAE